MKKLSANKEPSLFPVPPVLVSCSDEAGNSNIITVAWTGVICSDPPLVYISLRKGRLSYSIIEKSKEFVINLATADMAYQVDYCGTYSGREHDKFFEMKFTKGQSQTVKAPNIQQCPVSIECELQKIVPLGTHDMFIGKIVSVCADENFVDANGAISFDKINLLTYAGKGYCPIGSAVAMRGVAVKQKNI